jgi:RHS repeat-associated protein
VIAEKTQTSGDWTDYVFAGGKRIARADNYEDRIWLSGTKCSSCGWQWAVFEFSAADSSNGYVIRTGDNLQFRQYQTPGTRAGMSIAFTGNTYSNGALDQNGQLSEADTVTGTWNYRRVNLDAFVGRSIYRIRLAVEGYTAAGQWQVYYNDIVLTSADGTVRPVWSHGKTLSLFTNATSGMTGISTAVDHLAASMPVSSMALLGTTYYQGDHLGSSRKLLASNAYPVWDGTYLPFGQEWNAKANTNHFKFTGKERDGESGMDYFGARYYGANIAKWMTPDWSAATAPVPYADLSDPQTLNLYGYIRNNPLSHADADGHCCETLKATWNDFKAAAENTVNHTMVGFLTLVLEPDQAASGTVSSLKTAGEAYGTAEGRAQMAEQMSDPSTARQVTFEAVMTGAIAVAPGATGKGSQIESLGTITPNAPDVPTSIPAGPSARPTSAQQTAINEMGDAHGCHTCGATTPGTKSGNWVGDHQPSTALNPPGGAQVYKPQCLQCSRVQGGVVRAAKAAAAKKPEESIK